MVIKLSNQSTHQYVQLNSNSGTPGSGEQLTVMGFGDTSATNTLSIPTSLQQADVNYVPQSTCANMQVNAITSDMMCAAANNTDSW